MKWWKYKTSAFTFQLMLILAAMLGITLGFGYVMIPYL